MMLLCPATLLLSVSFLVGFAHSAFINIGNKTSLSRPNTWRKKCCDYSHEIAQINQRITNLESALFPTDLLGWTVFQRRMDGSVDFFRNWYDYRWGFGDPAGEFWLGLEEISRLMKLGSYELRVDMQDFDGNWRYAYYKHFHVGEFPDSFPITTSGYVGNAGDSMEFSSVPFSTKDHDHDASSKDCAETYKGAWWYLACHTSNLNGQYLWGPHESFADGVNWFDFRGYYYSLKYTEMKMRLRPTKP